MVQKQDGGSYINIYMAIYLQEQLLGFKSTRSNLYRQPQSTGALRAFRKYSNMAYMEWLKIKLVYLLLSPSLYSKKCQC